MKLIKLTQGQFAQIDDEDYEELNKYKWCVRRRNQYMYAVRNSERDMNYKQHTIFMHRVILKLTNPKIFGDHIDHNGLNNQRNNLRNSTIDENCKNRRPYGKSKYLGVYLIYPTIKNRRKTIAYRTEIKTKNEKIQKQFSTEIDAALCYNELAKIHHGQFANLNIISDPYWTAPEFCL